MGYQLLVYWEDETRTIDLPRTGVVSIGRAEGNDIRIDDGAVSRQHAALHIGKELELEDLGGSNGTWIQERLSGQPSADTLHMRKIAGRRAVHVGDRITFGGANAVVRHASPAELPALDAGPASGVVVRDPAMQAVYAQASLAARASISVLLLGETGVGKEILARAIHGHSPRAAQPFMGINCAALVETLLESELFGFERGAFTGATQARAGLFESAEGGTVFLDEVGELPLTIQAKLLRVLEERTVMRLGSNRLRPVDVRFVAATNRDLEAESRAGRFRADLFFRLNAISLVIPPLRERPLDIDPMIDRFVVSACRDMDRAPAPELAPSARELLRAYPWPGNIRELRNAIERAVALCIGPAIAPEHLPPAVRAQAPRAATPPPARPAPTPAAAPPGTRALLPDERKSLERDRITETLERCGGNQTEAARALGISRRTLISRLEEFALPRPRKRA
jgi:DNA-binding NtrC family response regulator